MKSILRISLGVLAVVGFIVALALVGQKFPGATGQAVCTVIGLGLGTLGVYTISRCLRSGISGGGMWGRYYERRVNPISFWCYIGLYMVFIVLAFALVLCSLLAPGLIGVGGKHD